jgi:hypothetical protein
MPKITYAESQAKKGLYRRGPYRGETEYCQARMKAMKKAKNIAKMNAKKANGNAGDMMIYDSSSPNFNHPSAVNYFNQLYRRVGRLVPEGGYEKRIINMRKYHDRICRWMNEGNLDMLPKLRKNSDLPRFLLLLRAEINRLEMMIGCPVTNFPYESFLEGQPVLWDEVHPEPNTTQMQTNFAPKKVIDLSCGESLNPEPNFVDFVAMEPLTAEDLKYTANPEVEIEESFACKRKRAEPEQSVESSCKTILDFESFGDMENDLDNFNFDLTVIPSPVAVPAKENVQLFDVPQLQFPFLDDFPDEKEPAQSSINIPNPATIPKLQFTMFEFPNENESAQPSVNIPPPTEQKAVLLSESEYNELLGFKKKSAELQSLCNELQSFIDMMKNA